MCVFGVCGVCVCVSGCGLCVCVVCVCDYVCVCVRCVCVVGWCVVCGYVCGVCFE